MTFLFAHTFLVILIFSKIMRRLVITDTKILVLVLPRVTCFRDLAWALIKTEGSWKDHFSNIGPYQQSILYTSMISYLFYKDHITIKPRVITSKGNPEGIKFWFIIFIISSVTQKLLHWLIYGCGKVLK